jgi:peroxiredoxin
MRIGAHLSLLAVLSLSACSEDPLARDPSLVNYKDGKASKDAGSDEKKPTPASSTASGPKPEITCKGKPEVGKSASAFTLSAVNGASKMAVEKGKVVLVDFWATWCEPCKKSFPKYQELYSKYKGSGFEILAVSVDEDSKGIPDFIKSYGAKFPVGWDEGHKIAECYQPGTMPSAYVIDKNGVVKHVHTGYKDGEEKALEKEIKALL